LQDHLVDCPFARSPGGWLERQAGGSVVCCIFDVTDIGVSLPCP